MNQKKRTDSRRDNLTDLLNREAFFDKVYELVSLEEPGYYALSSFDIDNFKVINDQYGSLRGDKVLKYVADYFRSKFEKIGGICCRTSSDHFVVLYPTSFVSTPELAEIKRTTLIVDPAMKPITFRMGIYVINDTSLPITSMYDRARLAQASVKGRYDVHVAEYDESMRENLLREQQVVSDMQYALEDGQFEPWFQPQYNHATGALIGAEALVRWNHPQRGIVPPDVFIPVFEKNGFIYEMDKSIWTQVCTFLRKWKEEDKAPLPISVNISRYDLIREDFFDVITGLLKEYNLGVDLLRLEITESAFSDTTEQIIKIVDKLIDYGFTVEIDDFGSGYSSFNTLKDVQASILKLDLKFLENTKNSKRSGNILESIIRMTKWLGMSVIAEGVETETQADYLKSVGCTYVQGYLYSKPVPLVEYEKMVASGSKERKMKVMETVENLDNNSFWDPKSMDTLIFNSYVGGACIFEYCNDTIELLRTNEAYGYELFGNTQTGDLPLNFSLEEHMDEENYAVLKENIQYAIASDSSCACEVKIFGLRSDGEPAFIRTTVRPIARTENRTLLYCTVLNMTDLRASQSKEVERSEQLYFLNNISHDLLEESDIDKGIEQALRKLLDYFKGDRAYILEINYKKGVVDNTYEVCKSGVIPQKDKLQNVPIEVMSFWFNSFNQKNYICIEDVALIDETRAREKRMLSAQGIHALIAVPLKRDGELIGFIGIDDSRQHQTHINRLDSIGDYMSVMITRRDLDAKIENNNENIVSLMNDTPGGFVRMRVFDDGKIIPLYANSGFCNMVQMSLEEILDKYSESAMWGVHPDDLQIVQASVDELLRVGEVSSEKYRLLRGDGSYVWIMFFGRVIKNNSGEIFFNIYYTEVTEKGKQELSFREMLPVALEAMLDSSTDYAFVKDRELKYICCSRAFAQMINMSDPKEIIGKTDYDLFEMKLADHYHWTDLALIESRKSQINFISPLPVADCKIRYANTSKYLLYDSTGEIIGLYGIGRDITETRSAYEQLKFLTNSIPGGIGMYELSPSSVKLLYFSEGFFSMTGYTREEYDELSKDNPFFLMYEEDKPGIMDKVQKIIMGESTELEYVYRAKTKNTGCQWIKYKGSVADRNGDTIIVNILKIDITSEKKIGEELSTREEELRLAMAQMGKTICLYDVNKKILTMPEMYAAVYGIPPVLHGMPEALSTCDAISSGELNKFLEFYDEIHHGRQRGEVNVRLLHADGTECWEQAEFVNIFDNDGKPIKAIIAIEDITRIHELDSENVALKENEQIYKMVAVHSNRWIYRYDINTGKSILCSNKSMDALSGSQVRENLPDSTIDAGIILPESVDEYRAIYGNMQKGLPEGNAKIHVRLDDGSLCWVEMKYTMIYSEKHEPITAIISFLNITTEHERELVYTRYQQMLHDDARGRVLMYFDVDLTIDTVEMRINNVKSVDFPDDANTYYDILHYGINNLICEDDHERPYAFFNGDNLLEDFTGETQSLWAEWSVITFSGTKFWARSEVQLVEDPYSKHVKAYITFRDITDEKTSTMKIRKMAEIDGMTGLYNKTTTETLIAEKLAHSDGGFCSLILVDLDNLKKINDNFGHSMGDEAIRYVAHTIKSQLRQTDVVGRVGGDEFVAFMSGGGDEEILRKTLSSILRSISAGRLGWDKKVGVSGSIGSAVCKGNKASSYAELFKRADRALYHVKQGGKNDFAVYTKDMECSTYKYRSNTAPDFAQSKFFDRNDITGLLSAVSTVYPLVIYSNITQNKYHMLQYDNYMTKSNPYEGTYEELVENGIVTFHSNDRQSFIDAFSAENVIDAFNNGKSVIRHEGMQLGDDGVYRNILTEAIFVNAKDSEDIITITLSREIPERKS